MRYNNLHCKAYDNNLREYDKVYPRDSMATKSRNKKILSPGSRENTLTGF